MDSPYPPVMPPQPPPGVMAPLMKPAAIQVFGILDLVLATFSIVGSVLTLVGTVATKMLSSTRGGMAEERLTAMQSEPWINLLAGALSMAIGVLLLVAGIQLLQGRRQARLWSNRYAWTAIGGKLLILVLTVAFLLPALQTGVDGMDPKMRGAMQIGVAGFAVLSALFNMIYPVLCLVFLNRPPVKEWLAVYGSGA